MLTTPIKTFQIPTVMYDVNSTLTSYSYGAFRIRNIKEFEALNRARKIFNWFEPLPKQKTLSHPKSNRLNRNTDANEMPPFVAILKVSGPAL
jgi:hypothetical protein